MISIIDGGPIPFLAPITTIDIALAFFIGAPILAAYLASRKGYNFWPFLILGLLTFRLIILLITFMMPDKQKEVDRS